ncbi:purine catabolism regulator [Isoptericola jiangsuensis]|uniref:Purine catabolism regulator n=1 Tax=Isoptericola jiangsuensis TaxID=548579 RepID=A0A2A9EX63_9MICO|nr:PucR family transcriptional regulator [Isoptericola jiangsuensis]PFG43468.1 purine catabolism regulator [Isoptericola jiangsuensis]
MAPVTALTLAEALEMPALRQAGPEVLAGTENLGRAIRWVHATELPDIARLLRPGDLVLTTGTGLPPDDAPDLAAFARTLADADAVGLVVELGRRWTALPPALVDACRDAGLPLVALTHETRFAHLTQAIGERIVDGRLTELREAQRVHETFTELSFTQAGPADVLDAVRRLAGAAVVLESAEHRPLDYLAGPQDDPGFLEGWHARSSRVRIAGRTGWDPVNGWLVTRLGSDERSWGRLVVGSATAPTQRLVAVAERAAAALSLHRLHSRDRDKLVRRTHAEVIRGLQRDPDGEDARRRADLAGFPTHRRRYVALVVRTVPTGVRTEPGTGAPDAGDVVAAVVAAAHATRTPALVAEVDRDVRLLLSAPPTADLDGVADRIAARLGEHRPVLVTAGPVTDERAGIDLTVREAQLVADAARGDARTARPGRALRLEDTGLRGLLSMLGPDERVRLFVDRQLDELRRHDARVADRPGAALRPVLEALLAHPGSKSDAAASLHLSRAAFYDRLARLERLLGADLGDADVRVSLHVALLADEVSGIAPGGDVPS